MNAPRPADPNTLRRIKIATQRSIELCGGQESTATITRVGRNTLSDYSNTGSERHQATYMPVDVLADIILDRKQSGEVPALLHELCRLAGGRFVKLPEPDTSANARQYELAAAGVALLEAGTAIARQVAGPSEVEFPAVMSAIEDALGKLLEVQSQLKAGSPLPVTDKEGGE